MSTRSLIARQIDDDLYRTIYCHMDGYLTHNGAMLLDHYNTSEKVDELLKLGDLSYLAPKLNPDPTKPHSFDYDERQEGVTVAYGRDRGKLHTEAMDIPLEELRQTADNVDYCYIFTKDNEWKYLRNGLPDEPFRDVEDDLNSEYAEYGISNRPEGYYGFLTEKIAEQFQEQSYEQDDSIEMSM